MNRIDEKFQHSKQNGKPLFIAYIMAGDPDLKSTEQLVPELEKAGVGIIELGVPFSDPIADGAVNQEAATKALESGTTLKKVLDSVKNIRKKSQIPIVLFSYLNPVLQFGIQSFAKEAASAGVDGVLALDLPPEESVLFTETLNKAGLKSIYLVTPTTDSARMKRIGDMASGFIYYVSRLGVTGIQKDLSANLQNRLKEIKKEVSLPIAVGFGISEPKHIRELKPYCDAIVVGSAIVKKIAECKDQKKLTSTVTDFVQTLTREL